MNLINRVSGAVLLGALLGGGLSTLAAERNDKSSPQPPKVKPYTLKVCPVSDEQLGSMGDPYVQQYKDREIKFCCEGCVKDFKKDPAKFIKKIEQAEAKASGLKPYTLATCLVSDEKLGEMGEPAVHKYQNREIKFCCSGCLKDFEKNPTSYIKKLEEAEKKQKKS